MKFLPHISRKFSALNWTNPVRLGRWGLLVIFVSASLAGGDELARKQELSFVPIRREAHVRLAETYFGVGRVDQARRELAQLDVLGLQTDSPELTIWRDEQEQGKLQLNKWQQITVKYPNYRDGYLMTGYYGIQTKEWQTAKAALESAAAIDPLDTRVGELNKYIE